MAYSIAVVNQSSMVSNADVSKMTAAIQKQLDLHMLPAWNLKAASVKFYADASKVPGYAWTMSVLDNSTQAGALGYHAEDNDKVDGFIFAEPVLSNNGVVLYDASNSQNVSVASVLSHEVLEMTLDRFANQWVSGPDVKDSSGNTYNSYAYEACDPVEGDSYVINVGAAPVSVSNFIFPSWTNSEAKTPDNMPFDYLKKLSAPFTMTKGGYMIVAAQGNVTQIFGEEMPAWKVKQKKSEFARAARRIG